MNDLCAKCNGACCREMREPPFFDDEEQERHGITPEQDAEMQERVYSDLPAEYPCLWLTEDGRCKYYDQRPDVCREDLLPGDEGCVFWRKEYPTETTEGKE